MILKISEEKKIPIHFLLMNNPFVERTVHLIPEEHIQNVDSDFAIYALGRISGEGSDKFNELGIMY